MSLKVSVNNETLSGIESSITNVFPNYVLTDVGTKVKFQPVVKVSGNTLTEDVDYKIEYKLKNTADSDENWKKYEEADFLADVTSSENPVEYRISGIKNYVLSTINTEGATVVDGYVKGSFNIIEAYSELTNKVSLGVCSQLGNATHTIHSLDVCGKLDDITTGTIYYN